MKSINCKMRTNFAIEESKNNLSPTNSIKKRYLNSVEQLLIYRLIKIHKNMFDDTLGNYVSTEYKI